MTGAMNSMGKILFLLAIKRGFIQAVIPYSPGGSTDLAARVLADAMAKILGQPLIPFNKPGAGGYIGGFFLVNSKPDGYTVGILANTQALPEVSAKLRPASYSSKDLQPVANSSGNRAVLAVSSESPCKTFQGFVDFGRKSPSPLRFGHPGVGNTYWQNGLMIAKGMGIKLKELPYNSEGECLPALLGGHIDFSVLTYGGSAREHLRAKTSRALCTFEKKRFEEFSDVPTIGELGFHYEFSDSIIGAFLPKATPRSIVVKLSETIKKVTEDSEVKGKIE